MIDLAFLAFSSVLFLPIMCDLNSNTRMALSENSTPSQTAMPQGWDMSQSGPMAQGQTSMPQGWDMSMSGGVPAETGGMSQGLNLMNPFAIQGAE